MTNGALRRILKLYRISGGACASVLALARPRGLCGGCAWFARTQSSIYGN